LIGCNTIKNGIEEPKTKTMKLKYIFFLILGNLLSYAALAQASDFASISVNIVTPITISKTADMNFGNVAINTSNGTVELSPDGTRTPSGGVTLPIQSGTVSAASFDVSGEGNYTYSISLPTEDFLLFHPNSTDYMIVNNFRSVPENAGQLSSGAQTITVGATLNVEAAQEVGTYQGSSFEVTVNYN